MLRDIYKHMDRLFTFRKVSRPDIESYWKLLTLDERTFAHAIIDTLNKNLNPDFRLAVTLLGSMSRHYDYHLLQKIGLPRRRPQDIDLMVTADPANDMVSMYPQEKAAAQVTVIQSLAELFESHQIPFETAVSSSPLFIEGPRAVQFLTQPMPENDLRPFDILLFHLFETRSTWFADSVVKKHRQAGVRLVDQRDPEYVSRTNQALDAQHKQQLDMADAYART